MSTITTGFIAGMPAEVIDHAVPKPVEKTDRIKTVDMVRGVALLGILLMNIPIFSFDEIIIHDLFTGPHDSTDFKTFEVVLAFFDGTMRGLFSMLFGAGMVLFLMNKKERAGGPSVAELYYRRLLWLVLFGLINAYILQWQGDILFYYGLLGMVLYPFRNSSPKLLIAISLGFMLIYMGKGLWGYSDTREIRLGYTSAIQAEKEGKKLTSKQEEDKEAWVNIEKRREPDRDKANENIAEMRGSYAGIFSYLIPINGRNEFIWMYYWAVWDCLFMMFMGMALYKLGFFSNAYSTRTYSLLLLLGYGIGIPLGYFYMKGSVDGWNIGAYLDQYRVPPSILYDIRRLLLCIGHVSLLMLIYRSRIVPWLMSALANVGQMAFTNYLMQSIICALFFYGYGLGYYHTLKYHQIYYVVFSVWVFQLIFSSIWLQYFRFGPFEWTWRTLTYWKKQKML
jgi:uncharacterized protein